MTPAWCARLVLAALLAAAAAVAAVPAEPEETLEDVVKTLKGQVTALLERRQEDYRLLEQSLRHSLEKSSELAALKEDLDRLRSSMSP
ncbi:Protein scabrous [Frankliniella fusca]|uniref:Protein scabrous n=1 Tax=Frankliniella fusca TaxID=407009 RepID=A0AAE1HH56_9NEOP|nr:Protein scabrous [Frankliniella fusca]